MVTTSPALQVKALHKSYGDVVAVAGLDLEGASLAAVSPQLLIILVWGIISFFAALKLFRWR